MMKPRFYHPWAIALCVFLLTVPLAQGQTLGGTDNPNGPTSPYDPADPNAPGGTVIEQAHRPDSDPGTWRVPAARTANVMTTRGGRMEFIAIGPPGQTRAAIDAITGAGGRLLRVRNFRVLGSRALVFDLGGLPLVRARALLAGAAPQTVMAEHSIFRPAGGTPRLYAARMLGIAAPGGCRLPPLRIGMIDGPVDATHPSLRAARITTASVLAKGEKPGSTDHGTAVAALIVGQDSDGALSGFATGAQLFAVNAFAREKRGPGTDVERIGAALEYLLASGVQLINMSFAGPENPALDTLLTAAAQRGALMIAAAGNDRQNSAAWPAAAPSVIAVTAIDAAGRRYRAANTGAEIEFAAPGVDLYVAKRQGGAYASGTSYAAPIVTALAARLVSQGASNVSTLRARLRQQSSDLGTPGRDADFGWGLVRAPDC